MRIILNFTLALGLTVVISSFYPTFALGEENKDASCAAFDAKFAADPSKARYYVDTLYIMDCLGGQKDNWELARGLINTMQKVPNEPDPAKVLNTVITELKHIKDSLAHESNIDQNNKNIISESLDIAIDIFNDNPLDKIENETGMHKPKFWEYHAADGKANVGVVMPELGICKDKANAAECVKGYQWAKQIVRYVTVTKRTLDYVSSIQVRKIAKHVGKLNEQWGQYFNNARSQFFWELGLNGWLYGAANKGKEGLLPPPDYQVIVLHPSVGLEYVDTKAGDRFREAIVLEGIGYNGWTWSDSKMKLPLGISLVGVYGDRNSVPQIGYGGLIHYNNNLSLGVTRRGSETGAILSLDLAKLFLKQDTNKQYEFKYRLP